MTEDAPTPPDELDESIRTLLDDLARREPHQLRAVATYASALVERTERAERSEDATESARPATGRDGMSPESGDPDVGSAGTAPATPPEGVPEDASVTIAEIEGTEYRYYQWREGDEIRSKTVERDRR